jgi:hypothetical protein
MHNVNQKGKGEGEEATRSEVEASNATPEYLDPSPKVLPEKSSGHPCLHEMVEHSTQELSISTAAAQPQGTDDAEVAS